MKAKSILVTVLGLLTTLFILSGLPQAIMNHGIEIACAKNMDSYDHSNSNNGNHYAYGHDDSNNGNHYAYGHTGGNNNEIQGTPASVPEPSTLLLLGAGIAGLWIMRRKLRK